MLATPLLLSALALAAPVQEPIEEPLPPSRRSASEQQAHRVGPTLSEEQRWGASRRLRVLYAGYPGGTRETAFREFLSLWFDDVKVLSLRDLDVEAAAGRDVVIADWTSYYGNDGYDQKDRRVPIRLGPEFTKPIIAVGRVADGLRPAHKLDWL